MNDERLAERIAALVAMSSGDGRLDTLTRLTCGRALSLHPLPMEMDWVDGASESESVVAAFTEQFAVDVSEIGANQRKQLLSVLGDNVFRTVVMNFVADFVPRVWAGLSASGSVSRAMVARCNGITTTDPIDSLRMGSTAVARLRALPRTTRWTGCEGRRSTTADCASPGARATPGCRRDRGLYSQIEQFESADGLTDAQKAALRYVDALIWSPSQIGPEVAAGVHQPSPRTRRWTLTWDVMRNAATRYIVSLGVDAPRSRTAPNYLRRGRRADGVVAQ